MRVLLRAVAALAPLIAALPSAAFEIDGFTAGQSVALTQSRATQRGMVLTPLPSSRGVYSVAYGGQSPHATITFCGNKNAMFAYTGFGVGGFDAFARLVEREDARLGPGAYSATTIESIDGPISRVEVVWRESWWTVSVLALMQARGPVSASRGLSAFSAVCQQ